MKRLFEPKLTIVLIACGGLLALTLLSAVLRDLTFQPSEPFSFKLFGSLPGVGQAGTPLEIPSWKFLLFGVLLVLVFVALLMLVDADARKRILLSLFRMVMTLLGIWLLLNYAYQHGDLQRLLNLVPAGGAGAATTSQTSMLEYVAPQISPWLVLAVSFGVGLALILLGWYIYSRRPKAPGSRVVDEIAGIARDALNGLQPGHDWDDAIVRAYMRMSEVVTAERGLIRQAATTPSEFARRMERAGLPASVTVRYAARILALRRRVTLQKLRHAGVQVVDWDVSRPFEQVIESALSRPPAFMRAIGAGHG